MPDFLLGAALGAQEGTLDVDFGEGRRSFDHAAGAFYLNPTAGEADCRQVGRIDLFFVAAPIAGLAEGLEMETGGFGTACIPCATGSGPTAASVPRRSRCGSRPRAAAPRSARGGSRAPGGGGPAPRPRRAGAGAARGAAAAAPQRADAARRGSRGGASGRAHPAQGPRGRGAPLYVPLLAGVRGRRRPRAPRLRHGTPSRAGEGLARRPPASARRGRPRLRVRLAEPPRPGLLPHTGVTSSGRRRGRERRRASARACSAGAWARPRGRRCSGRSPARPPSAGTMRIGPQRTAWPSV